MKIKVEPIKNVTGKVNISGSKNTVLPLMVCSMLTNEKITLNNVPNISDVKVMKELLEDIGIKVDYFQDSKQMILKKDKLRKIKNFDLVKKIRASIYVIGGLVANRMNFMTYYPGGCSFSDRPINYHLDFFKEIGYKIILKNNIIKFKNKKKINKIIIYRLPQKSVGTTINIIYVSTKRNNITIIENASIEPEVLEVIKMLKMMGAFIKIYNDTILIKGVKSLRGVTFSVISDRIEAGSYMLLACAVDNSDVTIENVDSVYLEEVIKTVKELGANVDVSENKIRIVKKHPINGINKKVSVYPSFPTDLQQILSTTCLNSITPSIICDEVYPDRISHIKEIKKANGEIIYENKKIYISHSKIKATTFYAHDLRCGFACIIIALLADDICFIENFEIVLRGYENIIDKLSKLKIKVKIVG